MLESKINIHLMAVNQKYSRSLILNHNSYFAFNIAFMYCLFLALVLFDNSQFLDERELHIKCHKAEHGIGWAIFLPKLSVLVVTSLVMTVIHWNFSLKHLFISQSKHPKFMEVLNCHL